MSCLSRLNLSSPLILAPLAGYTDLPFRLLCREFGADMCFSEMISCHGLVYGQRKTLKMLDSVQAERPVAFQLFGADPALMGQAADIMNNYDADMVDINMGCPVKKVTKKGAGAALMTAPDLAEKIIFEVVKNSRHPVSVKIRKGPVPGNENCCDFAKMAENCGAKMITVHGRYWSQGFTGTSDWQAIAAVKKAVTIPVIGNGDIGSYEDAQLRIRNLQCDGVMIGRGALGNPWVFSQKGRPDSPRKIIAGALRHMELMESHIDVNRLLAVVKNHIGRYFKTLPGSSRLRKTVYECQSFTELYDRISALLH